MKVYACMVLMFLSGREVHAVVSTLFCHQTMECDAGIDGNPAHTTHPTQVTDSSVTRSTYVTTLNGLLNIKLQLKQYNELFLLESRGSRYIMLPNGGTGIRISADYNILSVWYTFQPGFLKSNADNAVYGTSEGFNFGFSLIKKRWYSDYTYRYIRGLHLQNTNEVYPSYNGPTTYLSQQDMYYAALECNVAHIFNDRFSLRAAINQTELQLKSAGSVMVSGGVKYFETIDESPIRFDSIEQTTNYEGYLGIGYGYTYVPLTHTFISASGMFGVGAIGGSGRRIENNVSSSFDAGSALYRLVFRLSAGYNSERFYFGAFLFLSEGSFIKDIPLYNSDFSSLVTLSIGYRFVPFFLNKHHTSK